MAKAKSNAVTTEQCVAPDTLDGHIFYGLKLDDGQKAFRDAIYDEGKRIVFSNDGLIYYTEDHYESFELLYGEE